MMDACAIMWNGTEQSSYVPLKVRKSQYVSTVNFSDLFSFAERRLMKSLDALLLLQEDWDGYDAPCVSKVAIAKCKKSLKDFQASLYARMTVVANELGGVQLHYTFIGGSVCCDFGDDCMSYYIKWKSGKVDMHSFEEYTESNIKALGEILYSLA